jgi:hypothetical protein
MATVKAASKETVTKAAADLDATTAADKVKDRKVKAAADLDAITEADKVKDLRDMAVQDPKDKVQDHRVKAADLRKTRILSVITTVKQKRNDVTTKESKI